MVAESGLTCIDIDADAIRDPLTRQIRAEYREILRACRCVTLSHSGKGLHCWFRGSFKFDATFFYRGEARIEVYSGHSVGRFIAETGTFQGGRNCIPDLMEEVNVTELLAGWTAGRATTEGRREGWDGDLWEIALPECTWSNELLDRQAAELDAMPKAPGEECVTSWGKFKGGRSDARYQLICRAAALAPDRMQLAAWAASRFVALYSERHNPAKDLDREVARAWEKLTGPDIPAAGAADAVDAWEALGAIPEHPAPGSAASEAPGGSGGGNGRDDETEPGLDLGHRSLARAFVLHTRGLVAYVDAGKRWFHWQAETGLWERDTRRQFERYVGRYLENRADTLRDKIDDPKAYRKIRENLLSWFTTSAVVSHLRGMVAVNQRDWDANPNVIGTPQGVFDLITGEIRKGKPQERITLKVSYAPQRQETPLWDGFLKRIFRTNPEIIEFLQVFIGQSLIGRVDLQYLLFFHGSGGNGKGAFLGIIQRILGDYSHTVSSDIFMKRDGSHHPTEIAQFQGKRFVVASEVDPTAIWNESRLKDLTGGDEINGRFINGDFFRFLPSHSLVMHGNHKPALRSVGHSVRRRIRIIEFRETIATKEERATLISDIVSAEGPGIIQWIVDGCLKYQKEGLALPQSIIDDTVAYLDEEDIIKQWLDQCCVREPGATADQADVNLSFKRWSIERNIASQAQPRRLVGELENMGFRLGKSNGRRVYHGFKLAPEPNPLEREHII
jgi:putative DNA primase/helicase